MMDTTLFAKTLDNLAFITNTLTFTPRDLLTSSAFHAKKTSTLSPHRTAFSDRTHIRLLSNTTQWFIKE
jgi:hypothetical protein